MTKENKALRNFLEYIFCVVGKNSPYVPIEFLNILITAAMTNDFVNNTCNKLQPVDRLKTLKVGYQIFWKKDKKRETWLTKELKKLEPCQLKEYIKEDAYFCKNKTKNYVRARFIIILQDEK